MKKLLLTLIASVSLGLSAAESEHFYPNDPLPELSGDRLIMAQQHGMKIYMNNCMGCHSLEFQRYNRTARDLKIPEDILKENLMFTGEKVGDLMDNAMRTDLAKEWFGAAPPDLSLIARSRGTHWLYNYLRAFYVDESRPYGVNNSVFPNVGMPHVLERLQGLQKKSDAVVLAEKTIAEAKGTIAAARAELDKGATSEELYKRIEVAEKAIHEAEAEIEKLASEGKYFTLVKQGEMDKAHFDEAVRDLVYFLDYIGEPIKQYRLGLGKYVLIFIAIFFVLAYLLKKEYWKDVH